jgi:nucleoside-diphosphate-sugar epimerase
MSPQRMLLTGFPRCELARRVLGSLLQSPATEEIDCIVPDRYQQVALDWVAALAPGDRGRVRIWSGDVSSMDLGLSGAEFRELCGRVQVIHHCAAVTYTGAALALAESVNVTGSYEILELARHAPNLERLVHWSTASACGARDGVVYEDELLPPRATALIETRFRAERAMRAARNQLPVVILRPSMLVGDSQTGRLERIEGAHLLISGLLAAPRDVPIPRPASADALLHVVPIDYVVAAGLLLSGSAQAVGQCFHIVDPMPPMLDEALAAIAELVERPLPRGSVPSPVARAFLRLPGVDQFAHAERALIDELGRALRFSDAHARPVLTRAGLSCPPFTSYVGKLVAYVERVRRSGERPTFPSLAVL